MNLSLHPASVNHRLAAAAYKLRLVVGALQLRPVGRARWTGARFSDASCFWTLNSRDFGAPFLTSVQNLFDQFLKRPRINGPYLLGASDVATSFPQRSHKSRV